VTLKLRDGVFMVGTSDGVVLIDEETGQRWKLDAARALILRSLLAGYSAEEAAENVAEKYGVDLDTAGHDVDELVSRLRSSGLIEQ